MGYWLLAIRLFLGAVFVVAGIAKVAHRDDFAETVRNYRLLGPRSSRLVATWIPLVEIACGLLLVLGVLLGWVSLVLSGLLLVFAGAVAINLQRGRPMDCGCFGISHAKNISWATVVRNVLLLALAVALVVSVLHDPWFQVSWDPTGPGSVESRDAIGGAFLAIGVLSSVVLIRAIVSLSRMCGVLVTGQSARESVRPAQHHHDLDLNAVTRARAS